MIYTFAETNPIEKSYEAFKDRLTLETFKTKVDVLGKKKWDFVRASLLYLQALKCKDCDPNVAMMLLCSCADAMQLVGRKKPHRNFNKFYLDYCPCTLRSPPIDFYLVGKSPSRQKASFKEALEYIYENFRCLYVHEGIGQLKSPPRGVHLLGNELIDKLEKTSKKCYIIDLVKVPNWFAEITNKSLYKILP